MDRGKPDFARELATLESDVSAEVRDVLQVLRERKQAPVPGKVVPLPDQAPPLARAPAAEPPPRPAARESPRQHTRTRLRSKARAHEPVVLVNVTTRLGRDTNEFLTEAALRQKLKKQIPDTRQDIIEAALGEWFERHGFRRAADPAE